MTIGILLAIGTFCVGVLGWVIMAIRKDQGKQERDLEIARKDALLQKQMAAVPRPDEAETLKRLDDGTA